MRRLDRRRLLTSIADADRRLDEASAGGCSLGEETADALGERCVSCFVLGRLEEAWEGYERYMALRERLPPGADAGGPEPWHGETLHGGSLYLELSEGGFGDLIQNCRFIPGMTRRSQARITVHTRPELLRLFSQSFGREIVWTSEPTVASNCGHRVSCYRLPYLLRPNLSELGDAVPYLRAGAETRKFWEKRADAACEKLERPGPLPAGDTRLLEPEASAALGDDGRRRRPRIGLCWSNTMPGESRKAETLDLVDCLAPFDILGADFVALQKGGRREEIDDAGLTGRLVDLGSGLGDFADIAALIASLDLVITIDTSIAHLAGALGRPVWLVLLHEPDLRWCMGHDSASTWWYPTARLFHQPSSGHWDPLFRELSRRLRSSFP